jgi:hypothetical protein
MPQTSINRQPTLNPPPQTATNQQPTQTFGNQPQTNPAPVQFLNADELITIRTASTSRCNFAVNANRRIVSEEKRMANNVSGVKGKAVLDPVKVAFIKVTFQHEKSLITSLLINCSNFTTDKI